jgi:hypothetical protein
METKKDNKIVYSYRKFFLEPGVSRSCLDGGIGRVAFRIQRPAKDYAGTKFKYLVSFAFCSPKDNFSRRGARALTDSRAFISTDSNDPHAREFTYVVEAGERMRISEIVDHTIGAMDCGLINTPMWLEYATEVEK